MLRGAPEMYYLTDTDSGHYGRLNPSRYFNTTVTNVYVTATQSWVLTPWVSVEKRIRTKSHRVLDILAVQTNILRSRISKIAGVS